MGNYNEDLVIPASTYPAGGYVLSITKALAVRRIVHAQLKAASGTGTTLGYQVAPVLNSESGQSFGLKAYETGATTGAGFAEVATGSSGLEGLTLSVVYEGIP